VNSVFRALAAGAAVAAFALTSPSTLAQGTCGVSDPNDHGMAHGGPIEQTACATPASKAFAEANAKMHKDMAIAYAEDADVDFVRAMIPHHQGAIDMARIVAQHGKAPEIKSLAAEIITAQEKEIGWMRAWLSIPANALTAMVEDHDHGTGPMVPGTTAAKAFVEANAKMHKDMAIDYSDNADIDFARGMIPHHQGAIDMAKIVLEHGKGAQVKKLAAEIVAAQEREIAWMRDWLRKQGN